VFVTGASALAPHILRWQLAGKCLKKRYHQAVQQNFSLKLMQALYTMAGYLSGWIAITGRRIRCQPLRTAAARRQKPDDRGRKFQGRVANACENVPRHEFASMIGKVTD
jgi:hypothetical protein